MFDPVPVLYILTPTQKENEKQQAKTLSSVFQFKYLDYAAPEQLAALPEGLDPSQSYWRGSPSAGLENRQTASKE